MSYKHYTMSDEVALDVEKAKLLGRIDEILAKAAMITHPLGNRRYHHWIFKVKGDTLVSVFDTRTHGGKK